MADRSPRASARKRTGARSRGTAAPTRKRWWKRWWAVLLVFPALLVAALGLLVFFLVFSRVPLPEDIAAEASVVYDVDGAEVGGFASPDQASREDVDLGELPEHVGRAVLGVEDRDFYEHRGVSVTGVARALFTNVRSGSVQQGGSTITQQYVKNAATGADQTYRRKVQEAALAIKLEQRYSKDEILEFYLNTIYWGRGAYGVQAAARSYFDREASELTLNQAATLAGLIASPENLDPLENPERADARRRVSLTGMLEQEWIDQATFDETVAAGLPEVIERQAADRGPNGYYLDAVRRELSRIPEFESGNLYRGLRIHTELDQRMQEAAQEVLTGAVQEGPTDTGAIVTVDPRSGGVPGRLGGPAVAHHPLNNPLTTTRQPGSSFKPFTLQAFLEDGNGLQSRFPAPGRLDITEDSDTDPVLIRNFGERGYGEQTVLQATTTSTNTVYYQMQEEAGRERVIDAARRAGLPTTRTVTEDGQEVERDTMTPVRSLTLGVSQFTPLEMASAFGTYANEGTHVTPHLVTRVEDADGDVIYEARPDEDQSVDLNIARAVTAAMRTVVESGTGTAAQVGRPAAGKTGTTQDSVDAWFVGYVPQLATAVWFGNLDNEPIEGGATGGGLAAPVWGEYMARAVEGLPVEDFNAPDLSGFEDLNEPPAECPEGYAFADPPAEGDGRDVLSDITDDQGRPCVEIEVEEEQPECPEGFAFADPPGEGADPQPQVRSDIVDDQGRPCVEQDPQPEPEETETEEPEPEPTETETEEPEPEPTETEEPDDGDGDEDEDDDEEGGGAGGGGGGGGDGDANAARASDRDRAA